MIMCFFPHPAAHELWVDKLFCSTYLRLGLDNDFLSTSKQTKKKFFFFLSKHHPKHKISFLSFYNLEMRGEEEEYFLIHK